MAPPPSLLNRTKWCQLPPINDISGIDWITILEDLGGSNDIGARHGGSVWHQNEQAFIHSGHFGFPQNSVDFIQHFILGKWFCDANHWSLDAFTVTQYKTPWSGCRHCSTLITFNHFFGSGSCHSDFGCSGLLLYCQRKSSIALPCKYRILELKNKFPNYVYTTRGFNF